MTDEPTKVPSPEEPAGKPDAGGPLPLSSETPVTEPPRASDAPGATPGGGEAEGLGGAGGAEADPATAPVPLPGGHPGWYGHPGYPPPGYPPTGWMPPTYPPSAGSAAGAEGGGAASPWGTPPQGHAASPWGQAAPGGGGTPPWGPHPGAPGGPWAGYPHWGPPPARSQPRSGPITAILLAVAVVLLAVAGAGVGFGVSRAMSNNSSAPGAQPPFSNAFGGNGTGNGPPGGSSLDTQALAEKVDPSIVDIDTVLGYNQGAAAGTGIVLTSSGLVLTNNHVVEQSTSITATSVTTGKSYKATVVGVDPTQDVAVIQLQDASGLTAATLASTPASAGQAVLAIGNAGGVGGTPSTAPGSVVALGQSITASDEASGASEQLSGLIETDADLQPGDSGGPLVDAQGDVVGMDTAASAGFTFQQSGSQSYAIPIATANGIAKQIEAGHATSTIHLGPSPFLGVEVVPTSSQSGGGFGLGSGSGGSSNVAGAEVQGALAGTPAAQIGLQAGDVITAVGGQTVSNPDDLQAAIEQHKPGDTVSITWTDPSGQSHTASVQLASGPAA